MIHQKSSFNLNNEISVSAFPNPNNGKFYIQVKNAERIDHIEVINIHGINVYKAYNDAHNDILVDITNQPSGLYLVRVSTNGKIQTTKVVKN